MIASRSLLASAVGGRDEQDLGEVERDIQVDVPEAGVLLGVEELEQGRRRVAVIVRAAADLVDLVEDDDGVADPGLLQRAGQHVDRQVGRLELPEHIPGLGLQPPGRVLFLFLQALPDDLDPLVRQGVVVQRLLRLLDTLQHMPDPSEGGVVPRVALDLTPGVGDGTDAADRLPGRPLEPPRGLVAPRDQSLLGGAPCRVLFDLLQEPERGRRRRDLHAGEIEPPQRLADFPQAPLDGPAGPRDTLGPLVGRVRAAGLAQPFRRDLPLSQGGDLPAGGLEARRDRPLERLDELVERLQQVVDARFAAQLPEGRVDRCGDHPGRRLAAAGEGGGGSGPVGGGLQELPRGCAW